MHPYGTHLTCSALRRYQLIYAVGAAIQLASREERILAAQALLCLMVARDVHFFLTEAAICTAVARYDCFHVWSIEFLQPKLSFINVPFLPVMNKQHCQCCCPGLAGSVVFACCQGQSYHHVLMTFTSMLLSSCSCARHMSNSGYSTILAR
jgi:hypothetical protein